VVPKKKKIPQKEKMKIGGESMQKECWWKVFAPVGVGECFNDKQVILLLLFVSFILFYFFFLPWKSGPRDVVAHVAHSVPMGNCIGFDGM
jgi:hypothetical protein